MVLKQIEPLFDINGYKKIPSNLPEYTFYWHREIQGIIVLLVIDYNQGLYISEDQHAHFKRKITEFFRNKGESDVHILSLVVSTDTGKAKKLCVGDSFCWVIDAVTDRLLIYEGQVSDFYGWKRILENFLTDSSQNTIWESKADHPFSQLGKDLMESRRLFQETWIRGRTGQLPIVNICLVAINVIVFLICTFTGELLYNIGASGAKEIIEGRAYYRLFTAMFLHAGIQHLFSNMFVLYYIGEMVERKLGHIPYAVVYILSGVAGNIFSIGYEFLTGDFYSTVGASGAVFGVEGAMLLLVIINHGKLEYMTMGRLVFAIAFSLYCGFTGTNINNAAHVGGVLTGFAATAVIVMIHPHIEAGKDRNFNEN